MKCSYCGYEKNGEFDTCPQCGNVLQAPAPNFTQQQTYTQPHNYQQPYGQAPQQPYQGYQQPYQGYQQPYGQAPQQPYQGYQQPYDQPQPTPIFSKVGNMLKDPLFLSLCILLSAYCIWELVCDGLPIIRVILCIFLWIAYFKGQKNTYTYVDIQRISGTAFASYIVNYVLCGLFFLGGICMFALSSNSKFYDLLNETFAEEGIDLASYFREYMTIQSVFQLIGVILLVAAVLLLILNIFSRRYICTFLKSLHQSMINPLATPRRCVAARSWFYVFGILYLLDVVYGFSAISGADILSYLIFIAPSLMIGGAWIIAGILIKKYFSEYR